MMKSCARSLLALCLLALPFKALADDAALAAKLVGSWEGRWEYAGAGGKLTAAIASAKGDTLDGETKWFETVAGDVTDAFSGARLKDRKLEASGQAMSFVVTVSEDGKSMKGKWTNPAGASGSMTLKKKAD